MFGGHLPDNDDFTLSLLTNDEVLSVLRVNPSNVQIMQRGDQRTWLVENADLDERYLAIFNLGDQPTTIETKRALIGDAPRYAIRDLWSKTDIGTIDSTFTQQLAPHASALFRLRPA
jgi:hypothetical protein